MKMFLGAYPDKTYCKPNGEPKVGKTAVLAHYNPQNSPHIGKNTFLKTSQNTFSVKHKEHRWERRRWIGLGTGDVMCGE